MTTQRSRSKLIGVINLLLMIALGVSFAKLMWLVITPKAHASAPIQQNSVISVSQKKVINYGKLIADQHIFGEIVVNKTPVKEPEKPVEIVKEVPKVKLNAKLFGIIAYEVQNAGYALISNNGGAQKVYAVGDPLQDGVTISEIFPQKVILDNHGVKEELFLPIAEIGGKNSTNSSKTAANRTSTNSTSNYNTSLPTGAGLGIKNSGVGTPDLAKLRQELLQNPNKLTDIVRPSPATKNGEFLGFRIRSGSNRRLFNQLKFRNNDIITEINGIVLDSPNKGMEVFSQFQSATNLAIKLLRKNEEIYIDHSF